MSPPGASDPEVKAAGAKHAEVRVRIGGQEHVIRAEGDQDRLEACLARFAGRLAALREASPGIAEQRAVVLAVLSLADDLLEAEARLEERDREVERRVRNLCMRISAAIEPSL